MCIHICVGYVYLHKPLNETQKLIPGNRIRVHFTHSGVRAVVRAAAIGHSFLGNSRNRGFF